MTAIAINQCSRGTLLSEAGKAEFLRRKELAEFDWATLDRADPVLVGMLREDLFKRKWAGSCSHIAIVAIPDGIEWKLMSRGNYEWVAAGA